MQLPDSYEAMYKKAIDTLAKGDRSAGIAQFQRLADRLLSLSPQLRERREDLRNLLLESSMRLISLLRWDGQSEAALAHIQRMREALPPYSNLWSVEEALNTIDIGQVNKGLDMLRALTMQRPPEDKSHILRLLGRELSGAGLTEEADAALHSAFQAAEDDEDAAVTAMLLLRLTTECNDPDAMIAWWQEAVRKSGSKIAMYPLYERLSACGHRDRLENLLEGEKNRWVRRVFQGELARAKGDEEHATEIWQSIVDDREKVEDDAGVYAMLSALLFLGKPEEVVKMTLLSGSEISIEAADFMFLIVSLAQMGNLDEAKKQIQQGLASTRLIRPRMEALPRSHWLRVQRFPMSDEAREALRPFFVQA